MRAKSKSITKLVTVLLASAALGLAQTSTYQNSRTPAPVVPGSLNYVEGQVSLAGQQLAPNEIGAVTINPGQDLQTGNGYAEVLLTPGAFLRIGNSAEVQIENAGLANTRVRFVRGAGLLEVDQLIDGTNLSVDVDHVNAQVLKKGLYNFDESAQAVRVLDGKLKVSAAARTQTIGKDDQVLLGDGDTLKKTDFNSRLVKDTQLYTWSAARSQFEAQANAAAAQNATYYTAAGPGWYWDPYAHFYGFWPASAYLYSPFGFGFYSPLYFGYYGGGYYGHPWRYSAYRGSYVHGFAGGVSAHINSVGGFHGGGFHGGGHR